MADFVKVATLDQLAPGQGMTVTVRGVPVALFNKEKPSCICPMAWCLRESAPRMSAQHFAVITRKPPIPFSSWSLEAAGGHLWLSRRKAVVCTPEREVVGRVHHPRAPVRQYGGGSSPRRLVRKPID
jgi:hypothetical protein